MNRTKKRLPVFFANATIVEYGPDVTLSTNETGEFSGSFEGNVAVGGHYIFLGEGVLGSVCGEGLSLNSVGEFQTLFSIENLLGILDYSFPYL